MRRLLLAIGACVVLLIAGVVFLLGSGSKSDTPRTPGRAETPSSDGSTAPAVPSPETAAATAVAMTGGVATAGFISRRELIKSFSTPEFGPTLADRTSAQLDDLLLQFSQRKQSTADLRVVEQPLRTRVISQTPSEATAEVWSVLVVAVPGAPTATVTWRTVRLALRLVHDRWLVDSWDSTPGPTPMTGPDLPISPAGEVADRIGWNPVGVVS